MLSSVMVNSLKTLFLSGEYHVSYPSAIAVSPGFGDRVRQYYDIPKQLSLLTQWVLVYGVRPRGKHAVALLNDLSCRQIVAKTIICTNVELLTIWPTWTNFGVIWIKIPEFANMKLYLKISSAILRSFCPSLIVLLIKAEFILDTNMESCLATMVYSKVSFMEWRIVCSSLDVFRQVCVFWS